MVFGETPRGMRRGFINQSSRIDNRAHKTEVDSLNIILYCVECGMQPTPLGRLRNIGDLSPFSLHLGGFCIRTDTQEPHYAVAEAI
jgi:hypothetical protein